MAAPNRSDLIEQLTATFIDKAVTITKLKEQALPCKDEKLVSSNGSLDTSTVDLSRNPPSQLVSLDAGGSQGAMYPPNMFAPQAQTLYFGGYENNSGDWEGYSQYLNVESMDVASTGVYNENSSLMFHGGYGYNPQMPYGPYSPATSPLPNASDGQLYSPQHFPFTGHCYPQLATPSMPYLAPSTPMPQTDMAVPYDQQGTFFAGNSNSNGMLFGLQPGYHPSYDSFGRGAFTRNSENPGFYDLRQGFDGFGCGGFWSEWPKVPAGTGSLTPFSSPAASSQPIGAVGSFGQKMTPFASGMASQQQRSLSSYESLMRMYGKGSSHGGIYQSSNIGPSPSLGSSGCNLMAIDKRSQGKGNTSLCSCNDVLDILNEQNRGPRASRTKNSAMEQKESLGGKDERSSTGPEHEIYNKADFVTEYKDAKFFIIKSYSEDNVHKSIKYGVWASTMNGNRKLDGAYREAKEKGCFYPVFLFFSVNASAQFCGVAEMTGPVDFEKSVDYWQQDKWTGQFPVKWHIIKDVPNNLFRHIILENNDNKPVTNSRDTQEVKLDQGLEMLSIFKKHKIDTSMLDDFDFYEEREKAIQERKARQKQFSTGVVPAVTGNEQRNPISIDFVHQLSKSFADVVRVEEGSAAEPVVQTSTLVTVVDKTDEKS